MAPQKDNDAAKQETLDSLKQEALAKLGEAIELNEMNNRTKESRKAKAEACALILVALRAGVEFDPQDPRFQVFVRKTSWREAMGRACKEICNPSTALARHVLNVINMLPGISACGFELDVGNTIENFLNFFKQDGVKPQEVAEVYNRDLWNDFYDDVPKDGGGGGPSVRNDLERLELAQSREKVPQGKLQEDLAKREINNKLMGRNNTRGAA